MYLTVAILALEHVYTMKLLELLSWMTSHCKKIFGLKNKHFATNTQPLAFNLGLYNRFLTGGTISSFRRDRFHFGLLILATCHKYPRKSKRKMRPRTSRLATRIGASKSMFQTVSDNTPLSNNIDSRGCYNQCVIVFLFLSSSSGCVMPFFLRVIVISEAATIEKVNNTEQGNGSSNFQHDINQIVLLKMISTKMDTPLINMRCVLGTICSKTVGNKAQQNYSLVESWCKTSISILSTLLCEKEEDCIDQWCNHALPRAIPIILYHCRLIVVVCCSLLTSRC
jgi:hypothetical protein